MTFPLRLTSGETLPNAEALRKYIAVLEIRAKGKGYAAEIAKYQLERIKNLKR